MCATPFVYFFIPETKELPLEAMDHLFGTAHASAAVDNPMMAEANKDGLIEQRIDQAPLDTIDERREREV